MTVSPDEEKEKVFIVADGENGIRIDAFIASTQPDHVSRSRIKDIVKQAGVLLNGAKCFSPNQRVKAGDVVEFETPPVTDAEPMGEAIPLDIYYEDDSLLVINKPAGLVVHPAAGNWTGTLVNALIHHCGDTLSGIGGVRRPGIVHRLDKETSGLLVVAKTEKAHAGLTLQLMDHGLNYQLERRYLALVWGQLPRQIGTIDLPLARSTKNRKKRAVVSETNSMAKHAVTHYQVRTEFRDEPGESPIASLVECRLETGRTHQIRVHLSHLGNPLIGDQEYGKHFSSKQGKLDPDLRKRVAGFKRQALHAATLGFEHPETGEYLEFTAPPPSDFAALLSALGQRDQSSD